MENQTSQLDSEPANDDSTGRTNYSSANKHAESDCGCCKCCSVFGAWSGLQCCCCAYNHDEPFLSIKKQRFCTDIPCCLGFIFILFIQISLTIYASISSKSEPNRLIYWTDLNGHFCAPKNEYFDLSNNITVAGQYAAWPDLRMLHIRICVNKCSDTLTDKRIVTPSFDSDLNNVGIDTNTGLTIDISGYASKAFLGTTCVATPINVSNIVSAKMYKDYIRFNTGSGYGTAEVTNIMMNDLFETWSLYIICAITAFIFAVLWGYLVLRLGKVIIAVSFIGMLIGIGMLGTALIAYSKQAELFGYDTISNIMYWLGIILIIFDIMFGLAICFMYNRIILAIELVKETYRALLTVKSMFFYPIFPTIVFAGYYAYWLFGYIYVSSMTVSVEKPMPDGYKVSYYTNGPTLQSKLNLPMINASYIDLEFDDQWQKSLWFHIFVLFWMIWFIGYHSYMVIAGVYAEWYFADWANEDKHEKLRGSDKEVLKDEIDLEVDVAIKLSHFPIWQSFKRVTRYHLGTISFASLTIAIVQTIEYILLYLEKKFKNSQESPLKKVSLSAIKCILKCMKCILNRINCDGLIVTSIYGWPFCAASTKGISIIVKNILRAAVLNWISGYLEFLGKLSIIFFNVALCVFIANSAYDINIVLLPTIVCCIVTYCVTWIYLQVYEVGIRTIFICFLIDEERNKSHDKMKCSKELRKAIGAKKIPKEYINDTVNSERHEGLISNEERKKYQYQDLETGGNDSDENENDNDTNISIESKIKNKMNP